MIRDYTITVTGNGSATQPNVIGKLLALSINSGASSATRSVSISAASGAASVSFGPSVVGTTGGFFAPVVQASNATLSPIAGEYTSYTLLGALTLTVTGANPSDVTTLTVIVEQ